MPAKITGSATFNHFVPMAHLVLALFLIIFGLNLLFGLSLPIWISGLLALLAGVLLIMEHFKVRVDRK